MAGSSNSGGGKLRSGKSGSGNVLGQPPDLSAADEQDRAVFEAAMQGVERLSANKRVPLPSPRVKARPDRFLPPVRSLSFDVSGPAADFELEQLGEVVLGRGLDVDRRLVKLLRQGEPAPQASLDLHGRSAAVARDILERFLGMSVREGRSCVLVVHGRGHHSAGDGPVLKTAVVQSLAARPLRDHVIAFATAPRALGGEGALLVRLKRSR